MRNHACRFCVYSGNLTHLALLCGLWQSENVRSNTAGTGIYGCKQDIPAVAKVSQMALLCGLWQSGNVSSNTAGTGICGCKRDIPAIAEV